VVIECANRAGFSYRGKATKIIDLTLNEVTFMATWAFYKEYAIEFMTFWKHDVFFNNLISFFRM
jgi:hypothetical protein